MKRMALFGLLVALTVSATGCCGHRSGCRGGGCPSGACQGGGGGMADGSGGGMAPTVTYPYYTTRGPRDFFACNPGHPHN